MGLSHVSVVHGPNSSVRNLFQFSDGSFSIFFNKLLNRLIKRLGTESNQCTQGKSVVKGDNKRRQNTRTQRAASVAEAIFESEPQSPDPECFSMSRNVSQADTTATTVNSFSLDIRKMMLSKYLHFSLA